MNRPNINRSDGIAIVLWLLAAICFLMYAFGWDIGDSFQRPEQLGTGLFLFIVGALLP